LYFLKDFHACNSSQYWAERLNEVMEGWVTDESSLNRIIILRSEIDLKEIRSKFVSRFGITLRSALEVGLIFL
jgi:hypothetical protein